VISVRGSMARVGLLTSGQMEMSEVRGTVGKFVSIRNANSTIVAMITDVTTEGMQNSETYIASAGVDLLGEILGGDRPKFQRGVTHYPTIGDTTDLITNQELRTVYAPSGSDQINVGTLQQDGTVTAYVDVEEMLSKHFAVLGSTGVGKSTGVSLLLNEILKARLRRPRAGAQSAQPEAAVLAVQLRGNRRRSVRGPPRRTGGAGHPRRGHSARQGHLYPVPERRPHRVEAYRPQAGRLHR
jgi:DNA helicase HerA-like ATPase